MVEINKKHQFIVFVIILVIIVSYFSFIYTSDYDKYIHMEYRATIETNQLTSISLPAVAIDSGKEIHIEIRDIDNDGNLSNWVVHNSNEFWIYKQSNISWIEINTSKSIQLILRYFVIDDIDVSYPDYTSESITYPTMPSNVTISYVSVIMLTETTNDHNIKKAYFEYASSTPVITNGTTINIDYLDEEIFRDMGPIILHESWRDLAVVRGIIFVNID